MKLQNRTFLISGGSSGLGLATTHLLASHGAYISVLDLNPPPSSSSLNTLPAAQQILFTKTDVSSTPSLQAALAATLQWITTTRAPLSGVVACAGIGTAAAILPRQPQQQPEASNGDEPPVTYYDMALFDRTLAINLRGTIDLVRLALPHIARNGAPWGADGERGVVVLVSSVAAYEGQVGQVAYSASKAAVRGVVLPLARELGGKCGVRVVGVAPGVFETGMTVGPRGRGKEKGEERERKGTGQRAGGNSEMVNYPKRMGKGEEFARLVKEIIENPMINGDTIRLDGGVRMPSRL
jgi:NAD(P)-dependent dehydrogenase (short-subunit alcohol dehydrogenase family)